MTLSYFCRDNLWQCSSMTTTLFHYSSLSARWHYICDAAAECGHPGATAQFGEAVCAGAPRDRSGASAFGQCLHQLALQPSLGRGRGKSVLESSGCIWVGQGRKDRRMVAVGLWRFDLDFKCVQKWMSLMYKHIHTVVSYFSICLFESVSQQANGSDPFLYLVQIERVNSAAVKSLILL